MRFEVVCDGDVEVVVVVWEVERKYKQGRCVGTKQQTNTAAWY